MESVKLQATPRELLGKKVKVLRAKGQIPAILYGKDFKNVPLTLSQTEFQKVFANSGSSTIVDLDIVGKQAEKILIHEPQKDPVSGKPLHVDLYKVNMKEKIHTEIPLAFVGSSPAVEELEGNLITGKDSLEATCLPDKLVSEIKVDISRLKTFEDLIKIKDLQIPEGIEISAEPETIVAQVTPPRSEEELEEMEQEAAADAEKAGIENIESQAEKEKAEKEATKEGEEEAPAEAPKEEEKPSPEQKNV